MKMIAIGGEPATGKTTLMLGLIKRLGNPSVIKWGKLLVQHYTRDKILIFGDYLHADTFAGTDKLSMAVQPDAIEFVKYAALQKRYTDQTFLFEGDRLFTKSFLKACESTPSVVLKTIVLTAPENVLAKRHAERGDTQTETFLKSRRTKVENIILEFPGTDIWSETHAPVLLDRLVWVLGGV